MRSSALQRSRPKPSRGWCASRPAPPEVAADLGAGKMRVSGEVTVMEHGALKRIRLPDAALSPTP